MVPNSITISVPGDKSIAHRALILASVASQHQQQAIVLENVPDNLDVQATRDCLEQLGVLIVSIQKNILEITSPRQWHFPKQALSAQNSGTTIRLLSGLLGAMPDTTGEEWLTLTGDQSLQRRPMERIITPLSQMGVRINSNADHLAPLSIQASGKTNPHSPIHGIHYTLPVPSAQVKSAILLAGLYAQSPVLITEPIPTRDHTERLLEYLGAQINITEDDTQLITDKTLRIIKLAPNQAERLIPKALEIPGDFSSAAFWIVAATFLPETHITLPHIGLNSLRTGLLSILKRLGADLQIRQVEERCGEPVGTIEVKSAQLIGELRIGDPKPGANTCPEATIPSLIDELPLVALIACFNLGTLRVQGAEELRVKESDRIETLANAFGILGIPIETFPDGFAITGNPSLKLTPPGVPLPTGGDHRIAMTLKLLNAIGDPEHLWDIEEQTCIGVSYPTFEDDLKKLVKPYVCPCPD